MPIQLHKLCPSAESTVPDSDLLARFAAHRDEAAFAELVRRHGPLVYRVCRRLAPAVADDAFQAVLLALACRATSIRTPGAVGSWLVGVAGRVARQMRDAEQRRAEREREAGQNRDTDAPRRDRAEQADLTAVLDDELSRLPEKLRDPVVLCLVREGTHDQAAVELGSSVRTLRRRLERAKAVLRARLERRGVVPALAAALIAGVGAPATAVPPALVRRAVSTAFQFLDNGPVAASVAVAAKGVAGSMAKLNASALVMTAAAVLVCLGVGWSNEGGSAAPPVPSSAQIGTAAARPVPPAGGSTPTVATPPDNTPAQPPTVADVPRAEGAGVPFRGPNFVVHAPTAVMARVIASEAEYHRRTFALKWLGRELPAWSKPCVIHFTQGLGGNGGASTFTFAKSKDGEPSLASAEVHLRGDFMYALTTTLPHEVTHTVLASYFGRPLPRWADEGISLLSEPEGEQANQDVRAREVLNAGRGVRLKVLLPMTEYPRDIMVLYAQGHSLTRFLASKSAPAGVPVLKDLPHVGTLFQTAGADGHRRLVAFVQLGIQGNTAESWAKAANTIYGFKSLDELEEAWLAWLTKPENVLKPKVGTGSVPGKEKPAGGDMIPPAKLPTAPTFAPLPGSLIP